MNDSRIPHRPQYDRSRCDTIMIRMNFNSDARLYFSSFPFLFLNPKLYILNKSQLYLIFITARKLAIKLNVKNFKTRTVHFVLSLRIFVSAHVTVTKITAPGIFANLCSLVPKFHFQLTKEKLERSPGKGRT